jgi:hypothetical protein
MKRINRILFFVSFVFLLLTTKVFAIGEGEFKRLASGGIDSSANSYAWGLTSFNGDIYVSTNRHHLWSVLQGVAGMVDFPIDLNIAGPAVTQWGAQEFAEDMLGAIYRLKNGQWEKVYSSAIFDLPAPINLPQYGISIPVGKYPKAYGYRTLGTYNGHIYALGVGTWMPPMPQSSIVRSATGNLGDWVDVTGNLAQTTNIREFVEWRGKVYVAASIPGNNVGNTGGCVVFGSSEGDGTDWEQISEVGFGNLDNAEIYHITVFNDHLYASTVNYKTGFEVWKTNGLLAANGKMVWKRIIKDGFGDTWNQYGMTMQPMGNYLYIGTAVGIGMVLKDGQPVGTRAFDVIRVDKNDKARLLVGAYFPKDPPAGWPTFRVPLSLLPAGFGNPFNVYVWHMGVYKDWLVLGTLDLSGTLLRTLKDLLVSNPTAAIKLLHELDADVLPYLSSQLEVLKKLDLNDPTMAAAALKIVDYLYNKYGGADLWKTKNGINWEPVTLSGFRNPLNYGIRRTVPIVDDYGKEHLFIGTANPFTGVPGGGFEVLATPPLNMVK